MRPTRDSITISFPTVVSPSESSAGYEKMKSFVDLPLSRSVVGLCVSVAEKVAGNLDEASAD